MKNNVPATVFVTCQRLAKLGDDQRKPFPIDLSTKARGQAEEEPMARRYTSSTNRGQERRPHTA